MSSTWNHCKISWKVIPHFKLKKLLEITRCCQENSPSKNSHTLAPSNEITISRRQYRDVYQRRTLHKEVFYRAQLSPGWCPTSGCATSQPNNLACKNCFHWLLWNKTSDWLSQTVEQALLGSFILVDIFWFLSAITGACSPD